MLHCWHYFRKTVFYWYRFNTVKHSPPHLFMDTADGRVFYSRVILVDALYTPQAKPISNARNTPLKQNKLRRILFGLYSAYADFTSPPKRYVLFDYWWSYIPCQKCSSLQNGPICKMVYVVCISKIIYLMGVLHVVNSEQATNRLVSIAFSHLRCV